MTCAWSEAKYPDEGLGCGDALRISYVAGCLPAAVAGSMVKMRSGADPSVIVDRPQLNLSPNPVAKSLHRWR
ncbi:hypothetical protein CIW54_16620 [Paraburkholderia sp. T12-10]|nr:hypothetical protein CIW54_16620 [Paraburkholderia sp. T12-10]